VSHVDDRWYVERDGRKVPTSRHGRGKRWQATYIVDGPERTKAFERRQDALDHLVTVQAEALRGEYVDRTDRTTVVEKARQYAASRPHNPRTRRRVASWIKNDIEDTPLGARRLRDVKPSEVQAWVTDRSRKLALSTLRNLVSFVRSVFAAAVLDRQIGTSPCVRLSLPSARRKRIVPLTVEQVRALAAAIPLRNRAMVVVQAGLGPRIGELLALRAQDVDFLHRTVRVETQIAPGERTRCDPKTPTSKRTIPLPAVVAEWLAEHMRLFPPLEDGTLFYTRFGQVYRHDAQIFKAAVRRAGLPEDTTPHDLGHHYASVLIHAGESVIAVAERLGHEDATLVLKTYGHIMPNAEDSTRRAVDVAWSADAATDWGRTEAGS
jgi:integrase